MAKKTVAQKKKTKKMSPKKKAISKSKPKKTSLPALTLTVAKSSFFKKDVAFISCGIVSGDLRSAISIPTCRAKALVTTSLECDRCFSM